LALIVTDETMNANHRVFDGLLSGLKNWFVNPQKGRNQRGREFSAKISACESNLLSCQRTQFGLSRNGEFEIGVRIGVNPCGKAGYTKNARWPL
jgi:hypothetical protein